MVNPKGEPCKIYACRLQDCLKNYKYQEDKCRSVIEELEDCCRRMRRKLTKEQYGRLVVCSGFNSNKKNENY
ncbi:hypothetical protein SNEBB_007670 [Seison nebaliae]|nr:hypothetical protein SNEBB_007670 [Seison nebaliae]